MLDNSATENQLGSRLQSHLKLKHVPPNDDWLNLIDFVQKKIRVLTEVQFDSEEMAARLFLLTDGNMRTLFNNLIVAHVTAEKEARAMTLDDMVLAFQSRLKTHPLVEPIENIVHLLPSNQCLIEMEDINAAS